MDDEKQQEVRRVLERLLDGADMDTMTEAKVRKMVASQTGLNPQNLELKKLVKELIDEYLERLNEQEEQEEGEKAADEVCVVSREEEKEDEEEEDDGAEDLPKKKAKQRGSERDERQEQTKKKVKQQAVERDEDGSIIICQLSAKRNLAVQDWKGKTLVSIREYYEKDGKMMPSSKGISLTAEQWESLKNGIPSIEKAIKSLT